MKYVNSFATFINEYSDANDPVLIKNRAAKDSFLKNKNEYKKRLANRIYGKKRDKLELFLIDITNELKDLYDKKHNILIDMENEAGQLGIDDFEKLGLHNKYGNLLNEIDNEIEKLIKKRNQIEIKLNI